MVFKTSSKTDDKMATQVKMEITVLSELSEEIIKTAHSTYVTYLTSKRT